MIVTFLFYDIYHFIQGDQALTQADHQVGSTKTFQKLHFCLRIRLYLYWEYNF